MDLFLGATPLTNIKIYNEDAQIVIKECINNDSLAGIQIFFPDPWHKKKHKKRRLIQKEFIQLLTEKLTPGGYIHLATDWQDYAEHMLEVMKLSPNITNKFGKDNFASNTNRIETKFERRGKSLGHNIYDLVYLKD